MGFHTAPVEMEDNDFDLVVGHEWMARFCLVTNNCPAITQVLYCVVPSSVEVSPMFSLILSLLTQMEHFFETSSSQACVCCLRTSVH